MVSWLTEGKPTENCFLTTTYHPSKHPSIHESGGCWLKTWFWDLDVEFERGGKNGPLLWAHEPNPLRWLVQTDLWADKVVLRSLFSWPSHTPVWNQNPYPLRSPETTQWQRATCELMILNESKNLNPMVSSHMWRQGSLCNLWNFLR
jgi:hypothetical protein